MPTISMELEQQRVRDINQQYVFDLFDINLQDLVASDAVNLFTGAAAHVVTAIIGALAQSLDADINDSTLKLTELFQKKLDVAGKLLAEIREQVQHTATI